MHHHAPIAPPPPENPGTQTPLSTTRHIDYLDGWRGLAIIFLLIGHFFPVPGRNFGTIGVNLFFVLSGYLMGQLLFVKNTPLPLFFKRRASRILPAHIFFITSVSAVYFLRNGNLPLMDVVPPLLFVNNYVHGEIGKVTLPFGHIWSLAVEEHSYILLAIIAFFIRRMALTAIHVVGAFAVLFSATGFAYSMIYSGRELIFDKWLHTEVSAYGIFVSIVLMLLWQKAKPRTMPLLACLALFLAAIMCNWWSIPKPIQTTFGVGLLALVLNTLHQTPDIVKRTLSIRPLRMAGQWSFSLYLWQQPFYLASRNHELPVHYALALALALGLLSYYLIERPIRTALNRTWARA